MKFLKWFLGIACTGLIVVVLSLFMLTPVAQKRQDSVVPLNRERLAAFGIEVFDDEEASPPSQSVEIGSYSDSVNDEVVYDTTLHAASSKTASS
jgi:hypothetical protein